MCWQFWLDVGGTFTDCLARAPGGRLLRRKVLSSAVTKGRVASWSESSTLIDPARSEPDGFWRGYRLRLLASADAPPMECEVAGSRATGELRIGSPAAERHGGRFLQDVVGGGFSYELVSPEEAPLLAIRLFLGLRLDQPIPPCSVRLGTTRGTNALLTRRGAKTAFITTRGLADVLKIGYQNRPKLFELEIKKHEPLFSAVAEIDERISADGGVLTPPSDNQIRAELERLKAAGIESLAICLLNSYACPRHEQQVERIARQLGFAEISTSSHVSPLMKIVPRGDTTVVDAYLNPVLRTYVERIAKSLPGSDLRLMTSAGGLVSPASFTGKDSLLSGPAGGMVGCARVAAAAGFEKAIGFDMGGTSTDVARYDGRFEYTNETEKAGVRIAAPMLAIETVAAGGGSICRFDGVKLVVGPESAGAEPGPACYGRGGPLTITDCNLLVGRIVPEHFPFPLDRAAAESRLTDIFNQLRDADFDLGPGTLDLGPSALPPSLPLPPSPTLTLAAGFLRIANANMAQAIRSISIAKGYDPRDYVLVAFGSAAPQHACAVAGELGIEKILVHPDAGVLSALGIGLADIIKHRSRGIYRPLAECSSDWTAPFDGLADQARADVLAEGVPADRIEIRRALDLRYVGADASLSIDEPSNGDYAGAFAGAHQRLYGYTHANRPLEVVAARIEAIGRTSVNAFSPEANERSVLPTKVPNSEPTATGLSHSGSLHPGQTILGPALIAEPLTTTVIDAGWQATTLDRGELLLARTSGDAPSFANLKSKIPNLKSIPDPVLLELFSNHFTAIATQMGITLRNTAMSVNVKERLDFSCAIFTPTGDLVVNAPHIPVHLGAMSETVKGIIADNPDMQPGDVFVTNDPYCGGSHLPDVTVITPVFGACREGPLWPSDGRALAADTASHNATRSENATTSRNATEGVPYSADERQLLFFTASRAHHAEIGGITPGSMPPFSKNLAEEGVLIRNFKLLAAGQPRFDELRELLQARPYPSRSVETNLADIRAQLAANQQGANDLSRMIEQHSLAVVQAYMQHIQDAAERKMRAALSKLPPGRREFVDHLDDGTAIQVAITIHGDRATIDFTGTGAVSAGNLNANRAIVTAAVMYVLRLLVAEDIPLNQGVLAPVELILPQCLLNPIGDSRFPTPDPLHLPAIVGGNVETSQRVVDVLLGALGLAAASQGTMNNVLFGDESFGYYETICGGSGATANRPGADAVHTHMTNTRLTDPEVLEARYPVRLLEFSIRSGSGGAGRNPGGDGIVRRIEFLQPLALSILSQRRGPYPPYGMAGGAAGALGQNEIHRAESPHDLAEPLPALVQTHVHPGDILTIRTPGGGGWGAAPT